MLVLSVLFFKSFALIKIYAMIIIPSAFFLDFCIKYPEVGTPFNEFLKRNSSPKVFQLIGNPYSTIKKAMPEPISGAAASGAAAAGSEHVVTILQADELGAHALKDGYNGEKTEFKPSVPRRESLAERLIGSAKSSSGSTGGSWF